MRLQIWVRRIMSILNRHKKELEDNTRVQTDVSILKYIIHSDTYVITEYSVILVNIVSNETANMSTTHKEYSEPTQERA